MWGLPQEFLPRGTEGLAAGLALVALAGVSMLAGTTRPDPYHGLKRVTGVVCEIVTGTRDGVGVRLDTLGGQCTRRGEVYIRQPQLTGAEDRLAAVAVGGRITVDYDAWNGYVWHLQRADGGPGFDDADLARFRTIDRAAGRRRAVWILAAGIVVLVAGMMRMARVAG